MTLIVREMFVALLLTVELPYVPTHGVPNTAYAA